MTDRRFHEIVIESNSMIGSDRAKYHTTICKTCSQQHKVTIDDFQMDNLYQLVESADGYETKPANAIDRQDNYKEVLQFVAEIRAWQCCHEGETPIDGFPDEPEASRVEFGEI
jgi:hypothetical protein